MRIWLLSFCCLIVFSAGSAFAQQPMRFSVDPAPLVIKTSTGKVSYDVEIAKTPEQSEAGLMYRTHFPKNRAMLFIFAQQRIITMWMANTPLPLDMVFLDEKGVIVSIALNTTPYSTKIVSSHVPAAFTIELNAGDVQKHKIEIGQKVIHPVICGECKVDER
ncbi:DUF192 domain-containing protein [uncultured Bartonella sp.]|uniref:DUF192 domain-containing protein n=1 Tax=uncultured Bartonella sp. TaxID=104108 RepID=UPI0025D06B5F|nr:DUF192 domain-containing protein [uncultured Bartonella sp.]